MSGHGGVLARRLLWRVLLFSLCFTVLAGAVQLFFEYRREMREIEARLELIRSGYLASFERSLWDLNQEQLNVQLRGLGDFPDIARVSLQSADFNLLQGDQRPRGMLRVERFPLSYQPPGGERRQLGELEIVIDLAAVYRRLVSGGLASLLWMGSFLCGLAVALSWLFHSLVTRHLWRMSEFAGHIAEGDLQQPLRLDKVDRERDEIDAVAAALEDMRQALRTDRRRRDADRDELRRQVERRTASLRRAKDQAEAADRAKSRFLATMSHEIRTPLNGILGMAELLREASLGERDRQRLRALATAGEGLLAILNEVLHFARLEEAPDVPEAVDFSLRSLLEDVLTLLEPRARENATRLDLWLDPQVHDGHRGAEQFLRQVLTNLLGNAVKFTEAGEVRVRVERLVRSAGSERLRLSVADDGIGIPEEMRERIFERFTQGGDAVTRRYGGTGLGLAISRELVQMMGGRIEVSSEPGKGTRFSVDLPLSPALDAGEADELAQLLQHRPALLASEDNLTLDCLQALLERWGLRVERCLQPRRLNAYLEDFSAPPLLVLAAPWPGPPSIWLDTLYAQLEQGQRILLLCPPQHCQDLPPHEGLRLLALAQPVAVKALREALLELYRERRRQPGRSSEAAPDERPDAPCILVAEDNPVNQLVVRGFLAKRGYAVRLAGNGRLALDEYLRDPNGIQLILMDGEMPEMDGFEATRLIRREERAQGWPRVPIVALTAHILDEHRRAGIEAGMDAYLGKPVDRAELYATLERLLGQPSRQA